MFAARPIAINFGYFGEEGSLPRRPFVSTRWATDPDDMRALLDHARSRCVCGCFVDIDGILAEAVKETKQGPVRVVIIIADNFHGNHDGALAHAQQLQAAGTRLFVFQQGSVHNDVFKTLAETTGGAYFTYNPAVEHIAERLPRLSGARYSNGSSQFQLISPSQGMGWTGSVLEALIRRRIASRRHHD